MATNLVSAIEISLNSPDSVKINEEFTVSIDADSSETFDVKIFVHNSDDEKISADEYVSEIYDNEWKNPWYYLKEFFPSQKEYKIKVTSSAGERKICARLRNTASQTFYTECRNINILESENSEEKQSEESESLDAIDEETPKSQEEDSFEELNVNKNENYSKETSFNLDNEKLVLNPETIESKNTKIVYTKQEKTRLVILYSFLAVCIAIIILLALRRL